MNEVNKFNYINKQIMIICVIYNVTVFLHGHLINKLLTMIELGLTYPLFSTAVSTSPLSFLCSRCLLVSLKLNFNR